MARASPRIAGHRHGRCATPAGGEQHGAESVFELPLRPVHGSFRFNIGEKLSCQVFSRRLLVKSRKNDYGQEGHHDRYKHGSPL